MDSTVIAAVVFAATFGGALVGILLRSVLPEPHLSSDSKDVIKLGTGLIATMAALVLGLLIGEAKSAFDSQRSGFRELATNIILLDRALAHYGPETGAAREQLRATVSNTMKLLWPDNGVEAAGLDNAATSSDGNSLYDSVRSLTPTNDAQRSTQAQALQIGAELAKTRWLLSQSNDDSIPTPFLVVLVGWLSILFISFGLFSPRNATVLAVLFVCAMSVSGAVLLIVDLDKPFGGVIQISDAPLRSALAQLGK
jgi:hypothetical protein